MPQYTNLNGFRIGVIPISHFYKGDTSEVFFAGVVGPTQSPPDPSPLTPIWVDQFDLSALDPSSWFIIANTSQDNSESPPKATNSFVDTVNQRLVMRIKREPGGWRGDNNQYAIAKPYSGAMLGTYGYGQGWPTPTSLAKHVFGPGPFRWEARVNYPFCPGGWGGMWGTTSDRLPSTQAGIEVDWCEARTSGNVGQSYTPHMHKFITAEVTTGGYPWSGTTRAQELRGSWHVVRMDIWTTGTFAYRPMFYIDNNLCGAGPLLTNVAGATMTDMKFGILVDYRLGSIGTWGAGAGDTGPYQPVTGSAATDTLSLTNHGLVEGQAFKLASINGGAPLSAEAIYYARDVTASTWRVAATQGGAVINLTTDLTTASNGVTVKLGRGGINFPDPADPGPWDLLIDYVGTYDLTGVTPP